MTIELHSKYTKSFNKRILNNPKLTAQVSERTKLFQNNPLDPVLKNHALKGVKKGFFSFSIAGDLRIIYIFKDDGHVVLVDIGSHNQVY